MDNLPPGSLVEARKDTIGSQIAQRLREAILFGTLPPGSKINLERVRQQFDVSLSPLREALARLIADGLVLFEDNRGYRVAPISLANLREITTLRVQFETFALRTAIATGDLEWESNVIRALYRLNHTKRDTAAPETLEAWEAAHSRFHLTLIAGCDMPQLLVFCQTLLNLNDRYRRIFLQTRPGDRDVAAEHNEIAQATVVRDTETACRRLHDHIERTGTGLRRHLSTTLPA